LNSSKTPKSGYQYNSAIFFKKSGKSIPRFVFKSVKTPKSDLKFLIKLQKRPFAAGAAEGGDKVNGFDP